MKWLDDAVETKGFLLYWLYILLEKRFRPHNYIS